ncbi:MAG: dTDP-glucose 4,6-dehydratase [Verrucomicrobia bacterium]|nr:dTDP-glucose 4,6-dehydratase [Verrucomicrobiota bacterium]
MNTLLVTGGCGFIGCNFIRHLLESTDFDGRIINLDALTYAGNPLSLADLAERHTDRYHFVKADICDRDAVATALDTHEVDAICHFAAESHVDRSITGPGAFIQSNIIGTYTLLELMRERTDQIKLFHHVSTDEVYGSLGDDGFFTETTPYHPNSPYSASKASSDHLVRAYAETYGLPVTISNCSNNYGPYQFPEKLVPLMILNARDGKPLPVYGNGQNVRDWLYVTDHCEAIWTIMQNRRLGETYNVGGRNEMKNLDVVGIICDLVDEACGPLDGHSTRRDLITFVKDRPGHDHRYAIDCTKLENDFGWRPAESFETGIRKTIAWNLENVAWIDGVRSGAYQEWIQQQYG